MVRKKEEVPENILPEISGNRKKDLQSFLKKKDVEFGIQLLKHYVPRNRRLIAYCEASKDKKYITENLKAILS